MTSTTCPIRTGERARVLPPLISAMVAFRARTASAADEYSLRVDGRRPAVLMFDPEDGFSFDAEHSSMKSELACRGFRELLPDAPRALCQQVDQSVFCPRGAIKGVVDRSRHRSRADGFDGCCCSLGSWAQHPDHHNFHSPVRFSASIIILNALGETINLMTLGGLRARRGGYPG